MSQGCFAVIGESRFILDVVLLIHYELSFLQLWN